MRSLISCCCYCKNFCECGAFLRPYIGVNFWYKCTFDEHLLAIIFYYGWHDEYRIYNVFVIQYVRYIGYIVTTVVVVAELIPTYLDHCPSLFEMFLGVGYHYIKYTLNEVRKPLLKRSHKKYGQNLSLFATLH